MNMCESLVKPDCSKPKVMKSQGIQEALISMLADLKSEKKDLITLGIQYIRYVQNAVLKNIVQSLPNLEKVVLCEEKYSFTPDHFKAATHQQRKAKEKLTISHLRDPDAAINAATFRKDDIITTREGKSLISKFLSANAVDLRIDANVILDIDSELNLQRIQCQHGEHCTCEYYTTPIRCIFKKSHQQPIVQDLITVSQKKGEAEMAQIDWLLDERSKLSPSMSACSILTSGDIDAIPIHLYSLSKKWPQVNGRYSQTVSVILQKPHKKWTYIMLQT
ncbi:unnamed protein product [Mytilus coruscus]|uniref:Uncharacterized protein n=1 Tax=Mytilus coruscus TaxID=42192 RepID=A0A6J8BI60_MYTCO|nr:unnamed protein product [Mytilus coruscus]